MMIYLLSFNMIFSAHRQPQPQPITLDELLEKKGEIRKKLEKLYKPQWYNLYGYTTRLSDQEKIDAETMTIRQKQLTDQINEMQWQEQNLLFRGGYRTTQAVLLYLAIIGGLYKTQDYWKGLAGSNENIKFSELTIAPLMSLLRLNLKISEKVLDGLQSVKTSTPTKLQ